MREVEIISHGVGSARKSVLSSGPCHKIERKCQDAHSTSAQSAYLPNELLDHRPEHRGNTDTVCMFAALLRSVLVKARRCQVC